MFPISYGICDARLRPFFYYDNMEARTNGMVESWFPETILFINVDYVSQTRRNNVGLLHLPIICVVYMNSNLYFCLLRSDYNFIYSRFIWENVGFSYLPVVIVWSCQQV